MVRCTRTTVAEAESLTAKLDAPTLYRWRLGQWMLRQITGTRENRYRAETQDRSVDCILADEAS